MSRVYRVSRMPVGCRYCPMSAGLGCRPCCPLACRELGACSGWEGAGAAPYQWARIALPTGLWSALLSSLQGLKGFRVQMQGSKQRCNVATGS